MRQAPSRRRWPAFRRFAAFAQKKYDDGASDTEIKIGNTNPYSGPASAYAAIGKTIDTYFKSVNEAGGINGRKVKFISLDDGYSPAQDRRDGPPARRAGQDLRAVPVARHAVQHGDPQVHEPEEGAAALRRHRRVEVGRPEELPVDHGLPARLPHRGGDLRQAHPGQRQGRQDRRAAPERRLRPRLSRRLQGGAGQGGRPDRQDRDLRGDRSDGRQPDHPAQGLRRQRLLQRLGARRPRRRASARRPTSTGSRRTTSTTSRPRSRRS